MTGLDKILAQIKTDSDNICADISNKTRIQCDSIISEAAKKAESILAEGESKAQNTKDEIIARAKSAANLTSRAVILRAKQDVISSSLKKAREYFCNLPDSEYFELIYKMISKYSESESGFISLSMRDLARLPDDFSEKINQYAKGELTVCEDSVDIDGGFLLKYGGIEVNCAFASVFSSNSERFSDEVSTILFS